MMRVANPIEALSPKRRQEMRDRRRALIEKARRYEDLLKHPGWADFEAEVRAQVERSINAVLGNYPAPSKETPTAEMRAAQIDWNLGEQNMARWILKIPERAIREAGRIGGPTTHTTPVETEAMEEDAAAV